MRTNRLVYVKKNVKGMRVIRMELGVFDIWVLAVVGPLKHLQPFVRWNYKKPDFTHEASQYGDQKGLCLKIPGCAPCIWLPRKPRTPKDLAILAHECTHAAIYVNDWIGEPIGPNQSEVLCHTIGWLVENIMEHA